MSALSTALPVLVSAASGAAAGGLTSLLVGPSKAEREERGKRRIEGRSAVGKALTDFRYEYKMARLQRLEGQPVSADEIFKSALRLAAVTNSAMRSLSALERTGLRRRVSSIVGIEMIGLARLQPDCAKETTSTLLQMTAEKYRRDPQVSIQQLTEVDPSDGTWDILSNRIDKLARKYP